MKTNIWLIAIALLLAYSCAKDKEIGPDVPVKVDYVIPQGQSPADDRIVALFEKYGTYILYDYTEDDFNYTIVTSGGTSNMTVYRVLGNPIYVGDMLDVLEETWLRFYPDDFLAKNLPYRILLADTIKGVYSYERPDLLYKCYLTANTVSVAGLNEDIQTISAEDKRLLKNELQRNFVSDLLDNGKITIPREFYEVSDYTIAASSDVASENYARVRGFVPNIADEDSYGLVYEWCLTVDWKTKTLSQDQDLLCFLHNMLCHAEDEIDTWATYLTYPLVKRKHDILQEHFMETYGIDLQAIGNANE